MMRATASAAHKLHVWLAQTCLTLCAAVVAAGSIQAGAEAAAYFERAELEGAPALYGETASAQS